MICSERASFHRARREKSSEAGAALQPRRRHNRTFASKREPQLQVGPEEGAPSLVEHDVFTVLLEEKLGAVISLVEGCHVEKKLGPDTIRSESFC